MRPGKEKKHRIANSVAFKYSIKQIGLIFAILEKNINVYEEGKDHVRKSTVVVDTDPMITSGEKEV